MSYGKFAAGGAITPRIAVVYAHNGHVYIGVGEENDWREAYLLATTAVPLPEAVRPHGKHVGDFRLKKWGWDRLGPSA